MKIARIAYGTHIPRQEGSQTPFLGVKMLYLVEFWSDLVDIGVKFFQNCPVIYPKPLKILIRVEYGEVDCEHDFFLRKHEI